MSVHFSLNYFILFYLSCCFVFIAFISFLIRALNSQAHPVAHTHTHTRTTPTSPAQQLDSPNIFALRPHKLATTARISWQCGLYVCVCVMSFRLPFVIGVCCWWAAIACITTHTHIHLCLKKYMRAYLKWLLDSILGA